MPEVVMYSLSRTRFIWLIVTYSFHYRLMKIKRTNTNGQVRVPTNIKDGVLCHDS